MLEITQNPYGCIGLTNNRAKATWFDGEKHWEDSCSSATYWVVVTPQNLKKLSHNIPTAKKAIPVSAEMGKKIQKLIKSNKKWNYHTAELG